MAKIKRTDLKDKFKDNASPTGADFANLIDSFVSSLDDGINISDTAIQMTKELNISGNITAATLNSSGNTKISGNLGVGKDAETKLDVNGDARISGNVNANGDINSSSNISGKTIKAENAIISSGNIGIGTNTPSEKLEIAGGAIKLDRGQLLKWGTDSESSDAANITVTQDAADQTKMRFRIGDVPDTNDAFVFERGTLDGKSGDELIRINAAGSVGVGTKAPDTLIHAFGKEDSRIKIESETNSAVFETKSGKYSSYMFTDNAGNFHLYPGEKTGITMKNDTGNVGIGTTTPNASLDVAGDAKVAGNITAATLNSSGNTKVSGNLGVGKDPGAKLDVAGDVKVSGNITANGDINSSSNISGKTITSDVVVANSRLGVATANPNATLDVSGPAFFSGHNANLDSNIKKNDDYFSALKNTGKVLIGWNRAAGNGETDFIANRGNGSLGGFKFYDYSNDGVLKNLTSINSDGSVVAAGDINTEAKLKENGNPLIPRGMIVMWSGSVAPAGWALCDGQNGTPNLKGRFIVGYDGGDPDYNTVQKIGGEKTHALTTNEMPSHNHSISDPGHSHRLQGPRDGWNDGHAVISDRAVSNSGWTDNAYTSISINSTGGNSAHENRPPYYVLAYIMKL